VLLRRLADGQVDHDPFLTDLLKRTSIRAPSAPEPTPLLEPLTGRELAVLVELPTMKSNAEIAAEYFVSVNTVKSHLKAIYRKLDVNSRRAAVHRARELDLLA
jgi:LuxR family transcriptional regulator, maltose regulon positive regulatory protein